MSWRAGALLLLLLALVVAAGCVPTAAAPAPLDRAAVATLLSAADAARERAFAGADPTPLRGVFADSAIAPLLPQLGRLRRLGERLEERDSNSRLVHWVAGEGMAEGVLAVTGEERLQAVGGAERGWARIARQWFAALRWTGARWLVVQAHDLPPDQWWRQ